MDEQNWQTVKAIFLTALEKEAASRPKFLDEICANNAGLREEVESLLAAHEEIEDFIEEPVFQVAEVFTNGSNQTEKHFGHYKILREIGAGGMGAVFLAERSDGEFNRQVAIKIIRQAIAETEIINRFKRERQILASLNHPNIARLLDGGVSNDGVPFLAMEYIEGEAITKFAARENLNLEDRLKLFLKVCSAVTYAHRNLIVHRDLKPSNILVTDESEPKLLDFGLAKLLDENLTNDAAQTQTAFRALTPAYASPEQLKGEALTTASDIYSLGVIFYELLTGERPFQFDGKSLEEIIKTTAQSDPLPPSANPKAKSQNPKLRGDLDNIALMVLRKEPARRYQSVEQFADDIERYLKGLPVSARPNTFSYRASKFIKRHKTAVAAASFVILSIVAGIIATFWQAQVARREKEKAESINAFLGQMLKYSNPIYKSLQKGGQKVTISDILDEAVNRLKQGEFDDQPEVKAELLQTIAESYYGQGNRAKGDELMHEYVVLADQVYADNSPKRIENAKILAVLLFNSGDLTQSEKLFRETLPKLRDEKIKGNIKSEGLADALNNFAYLRRTQGDSHEAEMSFREALSLNPQMSADEVNYINGTTRSVLASTVADQGRFDEALQISREGVEEQRQNGFTETPTFAFNLTVLSGFLIEKGEFAEADTNLQEAEDIFRKNMSPTVLWLGDTLRNQAISLYFQGKFDRAIKKSDEALKSYLTFGKHYDQYPTVLIFKGLSLVKTGQPGEGEKLLREALEIRKNSLPKDHFWVAVAESALGECLMAQKKFAEAEPLLSESYENLKKSQGADTPRTKLAAQRLANFYEQRDRK